MGAVEVAGDQEEVHRTRAGQDLRKKLMRHSGPSPWRTGRANLERTFTLRMQEASLWRIGMRMEEMGMLLETTQNIQIICKIIQVIQKITLVIQKTTWVTLWRTLGKV